MFQIIEDLPVRKHFEKTEPRKTQANLGTEVREETEQHKKPLNHNPHPPTSPHPYPKQTAPPDGRTANSPTPETTYLAGRTRDPFFFLLMDSMTFLLKQDINFLNTGCLAGVAIYVGKWMYGEYSKTFTSMIEVMSQEFWDTKRHGDLCQTELEESKFVYLYWDWTNVYVFCEGKRIF